VLLRSRSVDIPARVLNIATQLAPFVWIHAAAIGVAAAAHLAL
jgi:hypothetical protein